MNRSTWALRAVTAVFLTVCLVAAPAAQPLQAPAPVVRSLIPLMGHSLYYDLSPDLGVMIAAQVVRGLIHLRPGV